MPSWATSMRQLASPISAAIAAISAGLLSERSPVAQRQQPWIVALRQAAVGLGGEHDPPGQLGLGDRPAAMRADLDHQDVADRQLRDHAHERHGDAGGVGVGELGEVAHPHQHLGLGQAAPQLVVAHDRGREAEMDRVEDRVGEERPARRSSRSQAGDQAVELAVAGRDQHRHGIGLEGEVERVLVQAEQEVRPGPRPRRSSSPDRRIDADQPALRLERLHGLLQVRETACRAGSPGRSRPHPRPAAPRRGPGSPRPPAPTPRRSRRRCGSRGRRDRAGWPCRRRTRAGP